MKLVRQVSDVFVREVKTCAYDAWDCSARF